MRARLALALPLVLTLSLVAASDSHAEAAQDSTTTGPPAGPPKGPPGGVPPGLADRDGNHVADDFQAKLAAAGADERFDVIVTFARPGNAAAAQRAVGPFQVKREFSLISGFAANMTAGQARGLARAPGVFRVEEDFEVRAFLDDLRDTFGIDAARADYGPSGAGTGICIVDTGIDHLHEQLDNGKVIGFCDATAGGCLVDAGGNSTTLWETTPFDDHGHGTHVGSIAAGDGVPVDTGNATAVARADRYKGVAPDAALLGAKVLTAAGTGTASDIISGVEWCVGHPEVDIINASLGSLISSDGTSSIDTAFNCAADPSWVVPGAFSVKCRYRKQDGKIVVLAAGNSGPAHYQIGAPAAAHLPITVGAIGDTYAHTGSGASFSSYAIFNEGGIGIAHFSSRGPTADERIKPDVAAPGWNVRAADFGTGTGYVNKSGTSMAAPTVAGAAALALEASATPLTNAEIKTLLENTAQDWGAPGKDIDFGAGVFDGRAFVGSAAGIADPEPMAFPTHEVIEDSVPDFGDWTYPFEVTDPDTAIMITVFNGGTWTCNWLSTICVRASAGADLEAELIDPGGAVLDLSTCSADFDTPCGVGEVWSGQTMFYDGSGGRQETLIARPPLALGTYTVRLFPFNGDASDAEPESSFIMDLSRGPLTTSGGPGGPQPPVAKAGPDQAVPDTDGDGFASVSLDGSNSYDPDGSITSYEWSEGGVPIASGATPAAVDLAVGVHVITLTVTDNEDMQGADDVQITVSEVNNPPSAEPDAAATDEDTPANVAVLAGSPADSDPDGDPLTVVSCESDGTTQGAVALNGNSCAYDPRGAFESLQVGGSATDTFTYTITDGELTDSATVTVMVNGVNDAPSAADDSQTTDEGVPATVAVLANDSDPESDPLTVASVADPAGGSASTDGTTVTYTPDPGFAGSDAFTYTVSDGNGGAAAASISVTVTPAAATTMHVAGLNLTATRWWWWWYSRVTITIEDGSGSPVPDATVSGSFSHAISGDISCTTNGAGQCGRTSALILDRSKSITFTVTDVTHATLAYQPGDNVATSVTANKP